ncbi:MAG TPA: hypothetical protein VGE38_07170 [Nocardioides sp.]|uniref:phage tail tube protein n=1 Tax=Nocardioides sp. TaxID=35761 RepID=UPI002EDA644D
MPKSLADAHIKIAICTTAPSNPAAPTVLELNNGIQAASRILLSDWLWTPTDSDKISERAVSDANNVNALGGSNYSAGMTIWRYFNAGTGVADPVEDSLFTATKVKGSSLWIYQRKTGKLETAPWASADEISLGGLVITDLPQETDAGGYIKKRIPLEPQQMYPNIAVA